jgi:hypothetical protein
MLADLSRREIDIFFERPVIYLTTKLSTISNDPIRSVELVQYPGII